MPKPKQETFADRLCSLREAAGLSQYEVAKRTGLSKETLSKLEKGDREPAWMTVRLLAHVLGVSITAFEVGDLPLPEARPTVPRERSRRRPPFPGDQPPDLSPEDEAALDKANDAVGKEE